MDPNKDNLDHEKPKPTGGLLNTGNSCYLNTTIACLGFLEPFRKMILEKQWLLPECQSFAINLRNSKLPETRNKLIDEFHDLVHDLWNKKHSLIPKKFLKSVSDHITELELAEQNDIHEFIGLFLNKLHEDIANPISITKRQALSKNQYQQTMYDSQRHKMDANWYETHKKEWSPLIEMFWGQTITQIQCGHCKGLTHNYEIYHNIMLTMLNNETNLSDCFDTYFNNEVLDEWKCDKCQQVSNSIKTSKLWRIPKVLIISLKRFNHELNKSNQLIEIPEQLDLSKWSLSSKTYPMNYQLHSIAYHVGNFWGGHYYATGKCGDTWWKINDLLINTDNDPDFKSGYVFFYGLMS